MAASPVVLGASPKFESSMKNIEPMSSRRRLRLPPAQPKLLCSPARTPSSSTPQHNPTAAATHGGRRHQCWFSQRLMLPRKPFSSEGVDDALPSPSCNSNHVCVHAALLRLAADRRTPLSAIIPVFSNWDVKSNNILLDHEFRPHAANFGLAKTLQREAGDRDAGAGASAMSRVPGSYEYIAPEYAYTLYMLMMRC
ncbi:hypothetical protein Ahy_B01g055091 [Arachis hypogaea]|uniref:Protein kinase domain-containing protein n=2 Tax=Arachis TaxID=3817 RepID=A0A445AV69_ARAHY|nr:hypothetical protein Ahy_B01g055091 [Arachis hypogaea]